MPRKPIDPDAPDKLQYYLPTLFSQRDIEMIERVAKAFGMSRGSAVRLMMRQGAKHYDPQGE